MKPSIVHSATLTGLVLAVVSLSGTHAFPDGGPAIVNPSFEGAGCPPAGWMIYGYISPPGSGSPTVSTGGLSCTVFTEHRTGWSALQIEDTSTGATAAILSTPMFVNPGQTVEATAWHKGTGAVFTLGIVFDSAPGVILSIPQTDSVTTATWTQSTVTGVAPADAITAQVLLYSCGSCTGTFYVDDVNLRVL